MKIYVPDSSKSCYVVRDKDTIRAYNTIPTYNSTINYTDYYINSHYIDTTGSQTFSQYTTLPSCINSNNITDNVFYRNDIDSILIITFILLLICFYFPYRILSRLFGRWLKW